MIARAHEMRQMLRAFNDEIERAFIGGFSNASTCAGRRSICTSSGTSNGRVDSMLGRYFRDLAVKHTHLVLQDTRTAANLGALRLGQPAKTLL